MDHAASGCCAVQRGDVREEVKVTNGGLSLGRRGNEGIPQVERMASGKGGVQRHIKGGDG